MPTGQKMIEEYIAMKPFIYGDQHLERGDVWQPTGSRYDDAIKQHHVRTVKRPASGNLGDVQALVDKHLKTELRQMCEERGLPLYGTKEDLAARILEYEEGA